MSSISFTQLFCWSFTPLIKFLRRLYDALEWKILVFLSPYFSQLTRDLCAQYVSYLSKRSSSFLLAAKNFIWLSIVVTPTLNSSTCFCSLLISLASGWVLEEPHSCNSAPQYWMFSFVFTNEFYALHSLVQASETTISHSSHRSHFSSNLKLGTPLFRGPPSSLVCSSNGRWS